MRMAHYFLIACLAAGPALLVAAVIGFLGRLDLHFQVALPAAILTVGAHTLLILFMIVTGRILREAIKSRDLPQEFLDDLNDFFANKKAYPAAIFGSFSIVAAGVLAFGAPALGLPPAVHWLGGLLALGLNFWALPIEFRALKDNQRLVDRAAVALDRIDRELEAVGEAPEEEEPMTPAALARAAGIVAISAWMPWAYWVFVVWNGDLEKTSIHPFVEVSVLAALVWWLARGEARSQAASSSTPGQDGPAAGA